MAEQAFAFPEERAARLVGRSVRRLRAWSDLVPPSIARILSPGNTVRLYAFEDVLALRVVRELTDRRVSTRIIRRAVEALRSSYDRPLTELTWAESAGQVYFQHPDGSWTGGADPLQLVFRSTIQLEPLRQSIRDAMGRDEDAAGRVERKRGRVGSKEVFAGTRIPVGSVVSQLAEGVSERELLESYPALTHGDIELARARGG